MTHRGVAGGGLERGKLKNWWKELLEECGNLLECDQPPWNVERFTFSANPHESFTQSKALHDQVYKMTCSVGASPFPTTLYNDRVAEWQEWGLCSIQPEGLLLTDKDLATSNSRGQHGAPDMPLVLQSSYL